MNSVRRRIGRADVRRRDEPEGDETRRRNRLPERESVRDAVRDRRVGHRHALEPYRRGGERGRIANHEHGFRRRRVPVRDAVAEGRVPGGGRRPPHRPRRGAGRGPRDAVAENAVRGRGRGRGRGRPDGREDSARARGRRGDGGGEPLRYPRQRRDLRGRQRQAHRPAHHRHARVHPLSSRAGRGIRLRDHPKREVHREQHVVAGGALDPTASAGVPFGAADADAEQLHLHVSLDHALVVVVVVA